MTTENFEQYYHFTNKDINLSLQNLTTHWYKQIAEQQKELANTSLKCLRHQIEDMRQIKNPQQFIEYQKACLNDHLSIGINSLRQTLAVTLDTLNEFAITCCEQPTTIKRKKSEKKKSKK